MTHVCSSNLKLKVPFNNQIHRHRTFSVLRVAAQTHHHSETGHERPRPHNREGQEFVCCGHCRSVLQCHAYCYTRERFLCRELQWQYCHVKSTLRCMRLKEFFELLFYNEDIYFSFQFVY